MRKKHLKHGFSLVELVVVTMLMGIITTALVMILRPSQQHYKNITNKAYEQQTIINATDVINGSLRYATNLKIIYADENDKVGGVPVGSMVDPAAYPSFIKLANGVRETIGTFDARGYAIKGTTATMAAEQSVLSKALFSDYDYQFSIEAYNTTPGNQSITIGIAATPMRQNASRTAMELDTDRTYEFSETFKFLNFINKGMVGDKMGNFDIDTSILPDKGSIYIFFAQPKNVKETGTKVVLNTHGGELPINNGAYDPKVLYLEPNKEGEVDYNRIYFVNHASVHTNNTSEFKPSAHNGATYTHWKTNGTATFDDDTQDFNLGQIYPDEYIDIEWGEDGSAYVEIAANQVYQEAAGTHQMIQASKVLVKVTQADFSDSPVKYFYYADDYVDTTALPNNSLFLHNTWDPAHPEFGDPTLKSKTKVIHYVHRMGDTVKGVRVEASTTGPAASVTGASGLVNCPNTMDVTLVLKGNDTDTSTASVYSGNTSTLLHKFTLEDSDPDEIWVCNGVKYDDPSAIPDDPDPITIHFVPSYEMSFNGLSVGTNVPHLSEIDGNEIPAMESPMVLPTDSKTDYKIVIAEGGNAHLVLKDQYGGDIPIMSISGGIAFFPLTHEDSGNEYWLYNGHVFYSEADLPKFSYEVNVHYLYVPGSTDRGLMVFDYDDIPASTELNGSTLADRDSTNGGWSSDGRGVRLENKADFDLKINLANPSARVNLMLLNQYDAVNLVAIDTNTVHDIWIVSDSSGAKIVSEEDWNAAKEARESGSGTAGPVGEGTLTIETAGSRLDGLNGGNGKYNTYITTITYRNNSDAPVSSYNFSLNLPDSLVSSIDRSDFSIPDASVHGTNYQLNGNFIGVNVSGRTINVYNVSQSWGELILNPGDYITIEVKLYNYNPGFAESELGDPTFAG